VRGCLLRETIETITEEDGFVAKDFHVEDIAWLQRKEATSYYYVLIS
jgi:hypothetical protein